MRYRGAGRGWRTLSRFALIGVIGGGAAACSSDASRLSDPFTNPFASSEPAATGSLPEGETATRAPAIRTPRIQSQALGAPGAMSARPLPAASRVASTEPVSGEVGGSVAGMNPDAGRAMTPRPTAAKAPATPNPRALEKAAEKKAAEKREAEAEARAETARKEAARREAANKEAVHKEAAHKEAEAKKLAEKRLVEKRVAERKVAETKGTGAKTHVRPGQTAKAEETPAKGARDTKADEAKAAREAARAEAARDAARRVADARAAEAAAKAAAKETAAKETAVKEAKAPVKETPAAPTKVASAEPASTGTVASDANDSFRWPAKGRVINGYGSGGNEGINIAVPEGTPVKAAEDGTVAYAGSDVKGYGKLVLVRHTNGYVSAYAHNGELDVRPGEKVKRGQTIAKSGSTGNVTSPQLHFEIRKGATPVDPMPHLASN